MLQLKHSKGFSTTETLTVFVIVIIIGALIISGLIHNAQRLETVSQVKKAYNTFNKAYNLAKMQEGGPESWARTKYPVIDYYKILKKYVRITHMDIPAHLSGLIYYGIGGDQEIYVSRNEAVLGRLEDGSIIRIANINPRCNSVHGSSTALRNVCGELFIQIRDINGNVTLTNSILGKNTFVFYITTEGFVPVGSKGSKEDAQYMCSKSNNPKTDSRSCTAWALAKENLDYLSRQIKWD